MPEPIWQPAIIASRERVLEHPWYDPGNITKHAGQRIRIWLDPEAPTPKCKGVYVLVHPDDAMRLWPEIYAQYSTEDYDVHCVVCSCMILTD